MDAVEFCKTVNRLCENQACKECPVYEDECCMVGFGDNSIRNIEETVSKVEQWAKDHPAKTRQSEFLKMFPDANMSHIEECFCVRHFDNAKICEHSVPGLSVPTGEMCKKCRYKFWNEEVLDNG